MSDWRFSKSAFASECASPPAPRPLFGPDGTHNPIISPERVAELRERRRVALEGIATCRIEAVVIEE